MSDEKPMGQVIQIDEARIRDHLGEMVRGTVEETLNAMLDAEADQLCGAGRYERSQARQDTRAGCACRKSNPYIVMMEPTQDWTAKNVTDGPNGTRYRSIFIQG